MAGIDGAPLDQGPIFLAGADRSGIGLLGELLERHPRIAMTRRTDFWTRYRGRFGDLRSPENVDRCLQVMAADRRLKVFEPDRDRLLADLAATPTYARLFESLQRQRMERMGKVRWGDKSLGSERHAEWILRSFPTARMIHVIRDPRDRYVSQKYHRTVGRGGVGAGAAIWLRSVRLAERNARRHPERYLILSYESLVADPEGILREVCDFIGEDYSSDLLHLGERTGAIHTRSVGRFRAQLPPQEVILLQWAAGRRLGRHGYDIERVQLAGWEKLRFNLVELPVNTIRMVLWGPWGRLSSAVGRPAPRS
jgi:hypothetical protein